MSETTELIFVQRVLPDRAEVSRMAQTLSAIDLQMMVTTGGRERAAAEHRGMLAAAGFVIARILPTQSEMSVMERLPA